MTSRARSFSDFLRSSRTRWTVWRAIEYAGIAALVACGIFLLLLPLLLWRDRPAMPAAVALLAVATAFGCVLGLIRRPTLSQTALEIDRQLNLADLLCTALAVRDRSDPWSSTILALANARAASISPSSLVLNRLGARAWGGIGLATALALTLALLSSNPTTTIASRSPTRDQADRSIVDSPHVRAAEAARGLASRSSANRADVRHGASDPRATLSDVAASIAAPSSDASRATSDGAGGTASARTDERANPLSPANAQSGRDTPAGTGATSPGGDGASVSGSRSTDVSTGVSSSNAPRDAPPWRSPTWPADRAAAMDAVRERRVPAAYRDLVREFFAAEGTEGAESPTHER